MKRIFLALILLTLLLAGCAPSPDSKKDDDGVAIKTYSDPIAENIVNGIKNRDYATFSKDFDESLKTSIPESSFGDILNLFDTKLGACSTYAITNAGITSHLPYAVYLLQCEKSAKGAYIKLVMDKETPHLLGGLWFDAAELR